MSKVGQAIQMLEMALPGLPTGTDPHKGVLSAIQSLSKIVPATETVPGIQSTQLQGLQKQASEDAMLQQLTRALGGDGGGPVPPVQPAVA